MIISQAPIRISLVLTALRNRQAPQLQAFPDERRSQPNPPSADGGAPTSLRAGRSAQFRRPPHAPTPSQRVRADGSLLHYPIPERAAKAVDSQIGPLHSSQQHNHGHVGERLSSAAAREQPVAGQATGQGRNRIKDAKGVVRQWHPVLNACLHPVSRHRPHCSLTIDLE